MPIDSRIALGVQPVQMPMADPNQGMNALARAMQVRGMVDEQKLRQQAIAEQNALNEAYKGAYGADGQVDRNKLYSTLATGGMGSKIPALQKQFMEVDSKAAEIGKTKAETESKQFEVANKRVDTWGQAMGFVRQNPTAENATAAVQHLVTMGVMPVEKAQQAIASIQTNPTPQNIAQWADMGFRAALSAKDQLAKFQTNNIGGQTITQGIDPVNGKASLVSAVQNTQSPDAQLQAQTSTENNKRSVGASYANAAATRDAAATNKQATIEAARIQTGFQNEQGLRKEFEALPEVKKYKQAVPSYKGIEDAVGRNTAQSDINIVYGIAKLYDPDSVVREGEYATVANSPNIPDRIKGYAQYLAGGGRLTPKVKSEILAEARSRMTSFENEFVAARKNFESIASRSNVDTTRVFPAPHTPAMTVDLGSLPSGGKSGGGKVINFGDLK